MAGGADRPSFGLESQVRQISRDQIQGQMDDIVDAGKPLKNGAWNGAIRIQSPDGVLTVEDTTKEGRRTMHIILTTDRAFASLTLGMSAESESAFYSASVNGRTVLSYDRHPNVLRESKKFEKLITDEVARNEAEKAPVFNPVTHIPRRSHVPRVAL